MKTTTTNQWTFCLSPGDDEVIEEVVADTAADAWAIVVALAARQTKLTRRIDLVGYRQVKVVVTPLEA